MKNSHSVAAVGTTLLLAALSGRAQSADKIYLDVTAGGAIPQNAAIQVSPFGNSGDVKFDTGMRAGLNVGYNFNRSFAGEFETGVIWNSVDSIQGNTLSTLGASADIYEIPFLANFIYKPLHSNFQPYLGVGVGGAATVFDSSNIPLFGVPGAGFSDTDFAFAYQAKAGFKYSVSDHVDLGIAYEFLGSTDHNWNDNGHTLKTDGTMTHAIMATFTWRF